MSSGEDVAKVQFMSTPPVIDYNNMPLPDHPCGAACDCMEVIASLRVSKVGGRGDDLISPELQLFSICQVAHAEKRRIVKIVPDIDKTGREFSKRRVQEIIDDIASGLAREVWLWKWSRWGRNTRESLNHIDKVEKAGGAVRASTENFTRETATGKFTVGMMLQIAELQSDQISEGWKETHAKRRRDGKSVNNTPRFGYFNTRDGYAINEDEAQPLREAYRRIVDGTSSFTDIASEWNALGIKTVAARRPNKPGEGVWSQQTLRRMMVTGFAAGWIRERSNPTPETRKTARRQSFDVWRKGDQPTIIDEDLWEAFKAKLDVNEELPAKTRWPKSGLGGLLVCALCGPEKALKLTLSNDGYRQVWRCPRRNANKTLHRFVLVPAVAAEAAVLDWLDEIIEGGGDVDARAAAIDAERIAVDNLTQIDERLRDLATESLDLSGHVLKKMIPEADAKILRAKIDAQVAELTNLRAQAELTRARNQSAPIPAFTALRAAWPTLAANLQREALSRLVEHFVVWPGPGKGASARFDPVTTWE